MSVPLTFQKGDSVVISDHLYMGHLWVSSVEDYGYLRVEDSRGDTSTIHGRRLAHGSLYRTFRVMTPTTVAGHYGPLFEAIRAMGGDGCTIMDLQGLIVISVTTPLAVSEEAAMTVYRAILELHSSEK